MHSKVVTGKDGPLLNRAFSFRTDVELRPCEQTTDSLGYTIYCDYVFPDGTSLRSVFEFDWLTGNVVLNRYGPIILQVPADAGYFAGTFDKGNGTLGGLFVTSGLLSLPLDTVTTLRAEPGTQLVIVDLPAAPAVPGRLGLKFDYRANSPAIKVMSAAKFQLGSRTFYPPLLPCVTSFSGLAPLSAAAIPSTQAIAAFAQPCKSKIYDFLGSGDPGPLPVTVVEFYNAALDHYFITWYPGGNRGHSIAARTARGWTRTGLTFNVYQAARQRYIVGVPLLPAAAIRRLALLRPRRRGMPRDRRSRIRHSSSSRSDYMHVVAADAGFLPRERRDRSTACSATAPTRTTATRPIARCAT